MISMNNGELYLSNYKCNACGYSADVLDQPQTDMYYTVEAKHCLGCKSLVAVAVEAHAASMIGGDGGGHDRLSIDTCPDCSSKNTVEWDATHSCPKCGEHMTKEAQV